MKNQIVMTLSKIDQKKVRLVLIIVSLTLFVLGAGAPAIGGEIAGG